MFAIASDGDLMEGVSAEASSLAGHLELGNLVVLYDDNRITIEGKTDLAWSEDVGLRYEAYGWHVQRVDGHDHEAIAAAIEGAIAEEGAPVAHRLQDPHRLRRPDEAGHRGVARLAPRGGGGRGGQGKGPAGQ